MKIAVIYYSFEGNTQYIAEALAAELGADIARLQTPDEPRTKGFGKYLWFGWQHLLGRKPRVSPVQLELSSYDLVIPGGPVWNANYAPPVHQFVRQQLPAGIAVAPFCCAGGGQGETFAQLAQWLPNRRLLDGLTLIGPVIGNAAARDQAFAWGHTLARHLA
jgi:flavodoxin